MGLCALMGNPSKLEDPFLMEILKKTVGIKICNAAVLYDDILTEVSRYDKRL